MRYFVGFLIATGLIIVLIVLLLTGGHGGKGSKQTPSIQGKPKTSSQLAAYSNTDAVVRMTDSGQINSDQIHTTLRITVSQNDVVYEQIQGYEGDVVNQQTYANNQTAYNNFLYALGRAGFTQGDSNPKLANEKGFCPLGHRFVFELMEGDHDIQRYWATNCGGLKTYEGNAGLTVTLFRLQVPDYQTLLSSVQNF